ncbi:MAG: hypothetical protein P4L53_03415 [Candidatus Obscuribacterales bacterium]|nr:hypothetical protein [Candidatus Obscuribacterales bacterium]
MNALSACATPNASSNARHNVLDLPRVQDLLQLAQIAHHDESIRPLIMTLCAVPTMKEATAMYFESTSEIDWEKVAEDPTTGWQILELLANHNSPSVRAAVADNINTTQNTLLRLAYDSNADLRYQLAENHNIGREVLEVLLQDENPYVRVRAELTHRRTTH